ncbi:hypothetical protein P1X14_11150 [Sphingomonas sp. AOB5]|nr:hypothetical protein [Sphingomonas sp. AOB5]MDF7775804.1 hypothetical protein [Sphingomonas sp. AOB5]
MTIETVRALKARALVANLVGLPDAEDARAKAARARVEHALFS